VAPSTTPSGSVDRWNTSRNCTMRDATPIATRKATYMPTPPAVGVARSWTLRSDSASITPQRTASRRATNVRE